MKHLHSSIHQQTQHLVTGDLVTVTVTVTPTAGIHAKKLESNHHQKPQSKQTNKHIAHCQTVYTHKVRVVAVIPLALRLAVRTECRVVVHWDGWIQKMTPLERLLNR
jgi:hypothetical protein